MKWLYNDEVRPLLRLPNGMTVTHGGRTPVLNEDILEMPELKKLVEEKKIRIEEEIEPNDSSRG